MNPFISICIPVYNGAEFLEECLQSCLNQSYQNFEIIICDDVSSDNSDEICLKFKEKSKKVHFFKNEKNLGLVGNWNECLKKSSGEWIKFLFQDDYLTPNALLEFAAATSNGAQLIVSKRNFLLPANTNEKLKNYYQNEVRTLENTGFYNGNIFSEKIISTLAVNNICLNFIGEPSLTMFKKEIVNEIGYFDENLKQICDLEFFQRIGVNYGLNYLPEKNCFFRIHNNSTTSNNLTKNNYRLRYIEPIVLTNKMLFHKSYQSFRKSINFWQRLKLKIYFETRCHEAKINSIKTPENLLVWEEICQNFENINKAAKSSWLIKLIFLALILWRKTRKN